MNILKEWINNKKLIFELAKNDFLTRYAGSYFGTLWAFAQPVVTVLLYTFVFQVAFHANPNLNNKISLSMTIQQESN